MSKDEKLQIYKQKQSTWRRPPVGKTIISFLDLKPSEKHLRMLI